MSKRYFGISFYSQPPDGNIKLDQVSRLVRERLRILKVLVSNKDDYSAIKGNPNYYANLRQSLLDAYVPHGDNFLRVLLTNPSLWSTQKEEALRRDEISHFLLRLFYSSSEVSTRWFVEIECQLLRFRLMDEGFRHRIVDFIRSNNLKEYHEVQTDDYMESDEETSEFISSTKIMFKVRFEDALELISSRRVVLCKGYTLVPVYQMVPVICQRFVKEMSECMKILRSSLPGLNENCRLLAIIEEEHDNIIGSISSLRKYLPVSNDKSSPSSLIETLVDSSFPPCMDHIHRCLIEKHHLRHFARLQYCLFLKSLGFRLEETIGLLREHFTRRIDEKRFNSKYGYFFRYIYGREGKKRNFSCYSCVKIINSTTGGTQDCHGCPFKEFNLSKLTGFLSKRNLPDHMINSIIDKSYNRQFKEACTVYFKFKNPTSDLDELIYHPSQFFQMSQKAISKITIQ